MKKAAEEKSAGTTIRPGSRRSAGVTTTASPSRRSEAPAALSMRSVWSRLGRGSITRVSPSARRPANSRQDLTWALATGSSYSMPLRGAPSIVRGGSRSSRAESEAPIARRGSATRSTGRRRIESSPSSSQVPPGCPASQPGSSRSRVPALPTSIAAETAPCSPIPSTATSRGAIAGPVMDAGAQRLDRLQGRAGVGRVEVVLDRRRRPPPSPRSAPPGARSTCPRAAAGRRSGSRTGRSARPSQASSSRTVTVWPRPSIRATARSA